MGPFAKRRLRRVWVGPALVGLMVGAAPALAQEQAGEPGTREIGTREKGPSPVRLEPRPDPLDQLQHDLAAQRDLIEAQRTRIEALEAMVLGLMRGQGAAAQAPAPTVPGAAPAPGIAQVRQPATGQPQAQTTPVGEAPPPEERPPEVTVLADQGGVVTQRGQITLEPAVEYGRSDRSRFVFRGVAFPFASFFLGAFDINESGQDSITSSMTVRYGVSSRFEVNARVPFVYRSDRTTALPVSSGNSSEPTRLIETAASRAALGDVELSARYQLTDGQGGWPFLIGNLQVVSPTGKSPYTLNQDALGLPTQTATGAGTWAISPSLTAILPSDPAVLFANIGYTWNLARSLSGRVGSVDITRVAPGDQLSASLGVGLALNPRLSLNFGYAHSWSLAGTVTGAAPDASGALQSVVLDTKQLQIGRYLFGVSYRLSPRTSLNWNLEVGATEDAPDVRLLLRVPISFGGSR